VAREAAQVAMTGLQLVRPARMARPHLSAEARVLRSAKTLVARREAGTIADLAREAGLGQSQFFTLFRKVNGRSPRQFQIDNLIDEALDRLVNGSDPVSEIAHALGYLNVSSFNRLFKRRFGITPTEFRALGPGRS
jgi:AraC-like DNA-binding protein